MPGLMAIREEFAPRQPLKGARISGSLHMTIPDRRAHRDIAGARRGGSLGLVQHLLDAGSCGRCHRRARNACVRVERRVSDRLLGIHHKIFEWADGGYSNMILDDGGDATVLLHLGTRAESDASVLAKPTSEEEEALFASIKAHLKVDPKWYSTRLKQVKGRDGRDHHRCEASLPDGEGGEVGFPGHQRE